MLPVAKEIALQDTTPLSPIKREGPHKLHVATYQYVRP